MTDGRRRHGGIPDFSYGTSAGIAGNRRMILDTIYGHYKEALDALPLEDMPALAPRLLDAGVCFGFADPVTNIIANTVCFVPDEDGETAAGKAEPRCVKKRKRMMKASGEARRAREEVISKIVAGDVPSPPEARTIAERSLEGLVSFLTSYFPYLPTWDAMRYLCLSCADLLVAVRLIEHDRCYRRKEVFDICSHSVQTALKCAVLSARQADVDALLTGSFGLASHLKLITETLGAEHHGNLSIRDIYWLSRLLKEPLKLTKSDPMELAALRFHVQGNDSSIAKVPAGLTDALRSVLLDRIHAHYLKALSRLPMKDFRNRHHRGLLKAGYCYGPLSPVSNIIVNSIWYDTAFPAPEAFEADMVCTKILIRLESRSLNGLIKFLAACIPDITEHDAMVYLLKSDLKIHKSIEMARLEGYATSSCDLSAYKAAADVSFHPQSEAYVKFVAQFLPLVQSGIKSLLQTSNKLSSKDVLDLSMLLSPRGCYPAEPSEATVELSKEALVMFSSYKETFISQQRFFRRKIEAALENNGHFYELRVICAVNERVGSQRSFMDSKCRYTHVNFLASPKVGTGLKLFFAEVSNDDENESRPLCCLLSDQPLKVRCCYCEFEGARIVHPVEDYCGGVKDLEKIARGEHDITHARIINHAKMITSKVGMLGEDYIYFDPNRDTIFTQGMNQIALEAHVCWSEIKNIAEMYVY